MNSTMFKFLMILGLLATSCMAQAPGPAPTVAPPTPTASPTPTPTPSRTPTPSPAPTPTPIKAPTPSPMTSPTIAPSPHIASPPALTPEAPQPGSDLTPDQSPPSGSGTFAAGWVDRVFIAGTALVGTFFAIVLA